LSENEITADRIRAAVKQLIAEITERELEEISDTALFKEELEIDSLAGLEMMVTVDKRFKIDIPEEEFVKMANVNEVVEVVLKYLSLSAGAVSPGA
jgi:acyl carrier protein